MKPKQIKFLKHISHMQTKGMFLPVTYINSMKPKQIKFLKHISHMQTKGMRIYNIFFIHQHV